MFKVAATVFHQIMVQLSGAWTEEGRKMVITKIILQLMKQNGC
jgi:hypothetical protein